MTDFSAWIAANLDGFTPPFTFELIGGGHSNLTYVASDGHGQRFVVRQGPASDARGMAREHRVLSALAATEVPVPHPIAYCDDDSPFLVMGFVDGAMIDTPEAADRDLPLPTQRRAAASSLVDTLAALHAVDVDAVGLGDAARRDGFVERQVRRFRDTWARYGGDPGDAMNSLADRLLSLAPPQRHTGIVHGDYRIGNVLYAPHDGAVVAVLDWELWTLGDVLADLAFMLNNWYERDDPTPMVFVETPPTISGDWGTRSSALDRYAAATGYDVSAIDYYRALQHWRMAVIAEGVRRRYASAELARDDVDHAYLRRRVADLATLATEHLARYQRVRPAS
ncbi:MAG: phosphotransferase family protein [Acidimicrobiia bacterium]